MKFKDKILIYLHNKSSLIDSEYNEHINYSRYHNVDEVDYLELIIRKVRRDTYYEISKDIFALLSLSDKAQNDDLSVALKNAKKY